jgi:hypothetical protein
MDSRQVEHAVSRREVVLAARTRTQPAVARLASGVGSVQALVLD